MNILKYPAFKFLLIFLSGLVIGLYITFSIYHLIIVSAVFLFAFYFKRRIRSHFFYILIFFISTVFMSLNIDIQNRLTSNLPQFAKSLTVNISVKKYFNKEENKLIGEVRINELMENQKQNELHSNKSFSKNKVKILVIKNNTHNLQVGSSYEVKGEFIPLDRENDFGEFHYSSYLKRKHIYGTILLDKIVKRTEIRKSFMFTIHRISQSIEDKIGSLYDDFSEDFINGVLLGKRNEIDKLKIKSFAETGTLHILAISGLHVGFVVVFFSFVFSYLGIDKRIRNILILILIFVFSAIADFKPSVLRASMIAYLYLISGFFNFRKTVFYNSLAVSAIILLIINPMNIFSIGFQLSFTAVFFIFSGMETAEELMKNRNRILKNYIAIPFMASLSAFAGTFPIITYYFSNFSWISIIMNIPVIFLMSIIYPISLLSLGISFFSVSAARFTAELNSYLINFLYKTVESIHNSQIGFFNLKQMTIFEMILYYLLLVLFFKWLKTGLNRNGKLAFTAILVSFIGLVIFKEYNRKPELVLFSADKDKPLLLKNLDKAYLFNGGDFKFGKTDMEKSVIPYLHKEGIDKIDYLISLSENSYTPYKILSEETAIGGYTTVLGSDVNDNRLSKRLMMKSLKSKDVSIFHYDYLPGLILKKDGDLVSAEIEAENLKTLIIWDFEKYIDDSGEIKDITVKESDVLILLTNETFIKIPNEIIKKVNPRYIIISNPSVGIEESAYYRMIREDIRLFNMYITGGIKIIFDNTIIEFETESQILSEKDYEL